MKNSKTKHKDKKTLWTFEGMRKRNHILKHPIDAHTHTHQRYGIFTLWWIINVFWSFRAAGYLPREECWTRSLQAASCVFCFFLLVDFYMELEGLGYVKPQELGCVRDASTCCASLLAPEFLCMSICTLERMHGYSLLRGELHAGAAEGCESLPGSCSHGSSGGDGER